jgi:hypothetical protein
VVVSIAAIDATLRNRLDLDHSRLRDGIVEIHFSGAQLLGYNLGRH